MTILYSVHYFAEYLHKTSNAKQYHMKVAVKYYSGPLSYMFYLFLCAYILHRNKLTFGSIMYIIQSKYFCKTDYRIITKRLDFFLFFGGDKTMNEMKICKVEVRRKVHVLH